MSSDPIEKNEDMKKKSPDVEEKKKEISKDEDVKCDDEGEERYEIVDDVEELMTSMRSTHRMLRDELKRKTKTISDFLKRDELQKKEIKRLVMIIRVLQNDSKNTRHDSSWMTKSFQKKENISRRSNPNWLSKTLQEKKRESDWVNNTSNSTFKFNTEELNRFSTSSSQSPPSSNNNLFGLGNVVIPEKRVSVENVWSSDTCTWRTPREMKKKWKELKYAPLPKT